jgi:hypothetical protein
MSDDLIELRTWLDVVAEKDAEIARLKEIKTPASAALVNITKAMLDEADAEIERLRAALERVLSDIAEYERINNLAPNPGREYCWDSVALARKALEGK